MVNLDEIPMITEHVMETRPIPTSTTKVTSASPTVIIDDKTGHGFFLNDKFIENSSLVAAPIILQMISALKYAPDQKIRNNLLQAYLKNISFRTFVVWALDPEITYGFSFIEMPKHEGSFETNWQPGYDESNVGKFLEKLAKRQLTGNDAKDAFARLRQEYSQDSMDLLKMVLDRDLRCGVTATAVNKVSPGLIPVFKVMLAHPYEKSRIKEFPVAIEPKVDGVRAILRNGQFYSRTGKVFESAQPLAKDITDLLVSSGHADLVIDGELFGSDFTETVGSVRRHEESDVSYYAFDLLHEIRFAYGDCSLTALERRAHLERIVFPVSFERFKILPRYYANSYEEIQRLYTKFRDMGYEGAIVKPLNGLYRNKRSHDWLKMKDVLTKDLRIIGFFEGEGKYKGSLGGLVVDHNGVDVKVGTGFTDSVRSDFWDLALERRDPHFLNQIAEVEYQEVTPDGSLRHPVFVRIRDDKTDSD